MKRRDVLKGAVKVGAAVCAAPFVARAQAVTKISLVGFGGSWGDFIKEFWIKPFTAETGIIVEYVIGADLARLKAQVATNTVQWDLFEGAGSVLYAGDKLGLWEPIDPKIVDPARFVRKPPSFAVPTVIYAGGIAYDPNRTAHPASDFSDLWNVKKFPGRRGLRNRASEVLEVALLADGVEPSKLYPLDVDRAFKALDRIKPDVKNWFAETAQGVTLIQTNECDYTVSYANRVKAAKDSGVSIAFSFSQCVIGINYLAVPKGSKQKEATMRFLDYITGLDRQALAANKMGVTPVTKGAGQRVDEQARRWLPDLNNPKTAFIDDEYWADHFVELDKRFKEWILT